jgi:uroporphyrinogen decarboxylase
MDSVKHQRVKATIRGERPDRVPLSFWTHFPGIDLDAVKLAETTYNFYRRLDLDFVKNMSNGLFSIEDWGCICDFSEIARGGVAKVTKHAIETSDDWTALKDLDINQGAFGRELQSLEHLLALMNGEAPVLATVFSPLTTAQKLCGPAFFQHLRTEPEKVTEALRVIAASTARYAARAVEIGCSGVYFASQLASYDFLTQSQYREFGVRFDLQVLHALGNTAWFNVMHIHGDNIMFDLLKDYSVQAISWHVWESAPTVEAFLSATADKCIVGGLQRFHITADARTKLAEDIMHMVEITGGKRLLLAPGCVIRAPFDLNTLVFIRQAISR